MTPQHRRPASAVAVAVAAIAMGLFVATYVGLIVTASGRMWDGRVTEALAASSRLEWLHAYLVLNFLGTSRLIPLTVLLLAVILWRRGRGAIPVVLVWVLLVAGAWLIKSELPARADGMHNSFPSGHVTVAAGFAMVLWFLVEHRPLRFVLTVIGAAVTALVSLSVVVMYWHRVSDVVAALLLMVLAWGLACAAASTTRDDEVVPEECAFL